VRDDMNEDPDKLLAELRVDIDRIDASIHSLLMERGRIIDRLIAIKGRQGGGSAFRPGREASMMRNLLQRHTGILPLDTVEGIWRIIISTFTYVQSNFSVHADDSGGDAAIRDTVRFHFGFTVPYVRHAGASAVIDAVAASRGDLGVVRLDGGIETGPWWTRLEDAGAPKIIARFPVVNRPNHPASLPVFVISKPVAEAASREVVLRCLKIDRWTDQARTALEKVKGVSLGAAADAIGLSLMIATPGDVADATIRDAFAHAGFADLKMFEIGSHAAIFEIAPSAVEPNR
jgi:chorismate mutase